MKDRSLLSPQFLERVNGRTDCNNEATLFKNAGRFSLGRLRYIVSLCEESPYIIRVRIFGADRREAAAALHQLTCFVRHLCDRHFHSLHFTLRLLCHSRPKVLRRSATEDFPFRFPQPLSCECGAEWPAPAPPQPRSLSLLSGLTISFRFATDLLLLSHERPSRQLLAALERVACGASRPLQVWAEPEAEGQCHAAATAAAHVTEARAAVVLVSAASNACSACELKNEAVWRRKMEEEDFSFVTVVMEENAKVPSLLRGFRSVTFSSEDEAQDDLKEVLAKVLVAL